MGGTTIFFRFFLNWRRGGRESHRRDRRHLARSGLRIRPRVRVKCLGWADVAEIDLAVQLRGSKGVGSLAAARLSWRPCRSAEDKLKSGRRVLKCRVVVVIVVRR